MYVVMYMSLFDSVYNERAFCGVVLHNSKVKLIICLLYYGLWNHLVLNFINAI